MTEKRIEITLGYKNNSVTNQKIDVLKVDNVDKIENRVNILEGQMNKMKSLILQKKIIKENSHKDKNTLRLEILEKEMNIIKLTWELSFERVELVELKHELSKLK